MASKRRQRRVEVRRERITKLRKRCPAPCGKTRAGTREEAWSMGREMYRIHGGEEPQRVYTCDISPGIWHWTRRLEAYTS